MDYYDLTYPWAFSAAHSDGAHYGRLDNFSRCDHVEWMHSDHGFVDRMGIYTFTTILTALPARPFSTS